jgi:hypothetical protein
MGRTTKIWECTRCKRVHISLKYYECNCNNSPFKNNQMRPEAKAFHLYFSIVRDIISNDEKAKLITEKIVSEIIESHLHMYDSNSLIETIKYWQEVKKQIFKI